MDSPALTVLSLNGRTIDLQRGIVADEDGHKVALRPQAAEVLKVLAARPGQLVGKDELVQGVWGSIAVTDDSLVQCIKDIRRALGDDRHEIVRTVHKRGYVLESELPAPARPRARLPRIALAAGAVALAALAAMAGTYFWPATKSGADGPALAVLPFENINGDAKWARFADGITEDIITDLARFRDIPVIARTSTEVYRDTPRDVREIGKALDVDYVLEGSLQVDGWRTRVTAQLVDARTGIHVWSERYDRDAADFFAVQDELTEKIVGTLTGWQGQLTEAERALVRRKKASDLNAFDYWLLGIEAKHRMTLQGMVEAKAYFEKGLELAPNSVPLLRDMAVTYSVQWDLGMPIDYPATLKAHREYIERALALDPNDANTNFQMGVAYSMAGYDEEGEPYRDRALQLSPGNVDILICLAWGWGGWRTDRALELVERSLKVNPRHPSWWNYPITLTYFAARQFDKAYFYARQFGESPNQAAYVAMSAAQIGKTREAVEAAAKVLEMNPDWTAESMFPIQNFADETLLPESAAKAGLPVCMTAAQLTKYSGDNRTAACEEERSRAASK